VDDQVITDNEDDFS